MQFISNGLKKTSKTRMKDAASANRESNRGTKLLNL